MDAATVSPPEQFDSIRRNLLRLERRDWWMWATAITIMLLLTAAIFALALPAMWQGITGLGGSELDVAIHGLLGLVLLFSVFVVYQQVLIKRLRRRLSGQIAATVLLQARADESEKLAVLDPLTELYNRRFADEHLPLELARAQRHHYPLTVLMLDLDDFKQINDRHGHAAGDAALRAFAQALRGSVRGSDVPVRMGGDEFMVMLPDCTAVQAPLVLSHLHGIAVEHGGRRFPVRFSAGWAQYRPGETSDALLGRADSSLYEEKRRAHALA